MDNDINQILVKTEKQLRRGVLELCVLSIIEQKAAYPSDIIDKLETARMIIVEGTLYPLLTRLKNTGLLAYNWQESNSGPPRKYYHLTEKGSLFLLELKKSWNQMILGVQLVMQHEQPTETPSLE